jgi:hypothetical protein
VLHEALDTRKLVAARSLVGGPAPEPMHVQLRQVEEQHEAGIAAVMRHRRAIAIAEESLFARARALANGAPVRD